MKRILFILSILCLFAQSEYAQQKESSAITKDANNPLASIKSISAHNVYSPSIHGSEGTLNTTWIRYAQPIGKVLVRASMPINTVSVGEIDRAGLGDLNIFGTYILTKPTSANQLGIGPIMTFPTATSSILGSGKWQIGAALAAYFASNPTFQCGLLMTWQHSFAGDKERNKVQAASIQPFFLWQLGKGLYLRSSAINILDLENGNYLVPVGFGMGKVIKIGKVICNIFAEPQFSVWHKGIGLPKTQFFIGCNTQF